MDWFLYDNGLRHERVKCFLCKYERIRKFCDAQKKKGNFEIELWKRFDLRNCEKNLWRNLSSGTNFCQSCRCNEWNIQKYFPRNWGFSYYHLSFVSHSFTTDTSLYLKAMQVDFEKTLKRFQLCFQVWLPWRFASYQLQRPCIIFLTQQVNVGLEQIFS